MMGLIVSYRAVDVFKLRNAASADLNIRVRVVALGVLCMCGAFNLDMHFRQTKCRHMVNWIQKQMFCGQQTIGCLC